MQKSILIRELQLRVKHRLKKHARQKHRGETFRLNRDNHQKYQKKKKKSTEAAFSQQEARSIKVSLYYKICQFPVSVLRQRRLLAVRVCYCLVGSVSVTVHLHRETHSTSPGSILSGVQVNSRAETMKKK